MFLGKMSNHEYIKLKIYVTSSGTDQQVFENDGLVFKREVQNFRLRITSLYMIVEAIGVDKMSQEECIE